jgi:hypothetical protein
MGKQAYKARHFAVREALLAATALVSVTAGARAQSLTLSSSTTSTGLYGIDLTQQLPQGGTVNVLSGVSATGASGSEIRGTAAYTLTNNGTIAGSSAFKAGQFGSNQITLTYTPIVGGNLPIIAGSIGALLGSGSSVINAAGATISGSIGGVLLSVGTGLTVVNDGTIQFTNTAALGAGLLNGVGVAAGSGNVTNNSSGYIGSTGAAGTAVATTGTLTNSGTIDGLVGAGGTVINNAGGKINYKGPDFTLAGNQDDLGAVYGGSGTPPNPATGSLGTVPHFVTVNNAGTITSSVGGIVLNAGGTVGASITNSGTITAGPAIDQSVAGNLKVTRAILLEEQGSISSGASFSIALTNSGTITGDVIAALGSDDVNHSLTSTPTFVTSIGSNKTSLDNNSGGTITGNVALVTAADVETSGFSPAFSTGTSGTSGSSPSYVVSSVGTITNAGTITGAVSANTITNSGTIGGGAAALVASGTLGASGNAQLAESIAGSLVNTGTINGAVGFANIDNAGTIKGSVNVGADIVALFPASFAPEVSSTLAATGVATTVAGTLINRASGVIDGHLNFNGSVTNSGTLGFGSTYGISNIGGNYTHGNAATLVVKIADNGQFDKLVVQGQTTLQGGTLKVVATGTAWNSTQTYNVLNSVGGLTGTFSNVTINQQGLSPSLSYGPNDVNLTVASGGSVATNVVQSSGRVNDVVTHNVLGAAFQTTDEIAAPTTTATADTTTTSTQASSDQSSSSSSSSSSSGGEQKTAAKASNSNVRIRSYAADSYIEFDSLGGAKSTIGGITLGTSFNFNDRYTIGVMVPLDYLSLPGYDAVRLGPVLFGQYDYRPAKGWIVQPTVYVSYLSTIALNGANLPTVGTAGVGTGVSVTHDMGKFITGGIMSFGYNKDDTDLPNNYQTLFTLGPRFGYRPTRNTVIEVDAIWNKDVSSYIPSGASSDYWQLNADFTYLLGHSFKLHVSYQTILGIDHFSSHRIVIGGRMAL